MTFIVSSSCLYCLNEIWQHMAINLAARIYFILVVVVAIISTSGFRPHLRVLTNFIAVTVITRVGLSRL